MSRAAGILMPITSLPGKYGIGCFSKEAYAFIDWLKEAGQTYWQILPIHPTSYGDSPYQSFSTFAGNPYFIDLEELIEEGMLTREECDSMDFGDYEDDIDYEDQYQNRYILLSMAYERSNISQDSDYQRFVAENRWWLDDYALFMALKNFFKGQCWNEWPQDIRLRWGYSMDYYRRELYFDIEFQMFLQYWFFKQYWRLKAYANENHIRIIGDIPIYVAMDSADTWAHPELFQLDENNVPTAVAGCPPDGFSATGQLWGNPLYRWDKMKETGFAWWIRRLTAAARMYDVVRLDHFRGFESFWAVPAGDKTAAGGQWMKGPGLDYIQAIQAALPDLDFIAEDLGYVTPEVRQLQLDSGYPSMKVLQFAFDSREESDYLPHTYPVNSVCYVGTHDNMTLAQWLSEADPQDVALAKNYLGLNEEEGFAWGMIRGAMGSVSKLCVIQMQDYLALDGAARMNFPGTLSSANWTWRAGKDYLSEALTARIYEITRRYARV